MKSALKGILLAGISTPLLLAACAKKEGDTEMEFRSVSYQCENGEQLEVRYGNTKLGPGTAMMKYQNKLITMHQERAASGALYVADKGQPTYRWHTQGDEGILSMQPADGGEAEDLLKECRADSL